MSLVSVFELLLQASTPVVAPNVLEAVLFYHPCIVIFMPSLWTRNFILLTLSGFLLSLAFYMLIPTLPVFLVNGLGADESRVGWIIAVYTLAALLIRPVAGYAVDVYGRKYILLISLLLFAAFLGMHLLAHTITVLLFLRFLHGLSWGVTTTANSTFIIDIVPEQRRGEGIGIYGLAVPLAMAVGPLAGLWLMGQGLYSRLFVAATAIATGAYLLAQCIRFPVFRPHVATRFSPGRLFTPEALPVSLVMMVIMVSYGGVLSFITLYALQFKLGSAGIFFSVYAVGLTLSRLVAGRIFDRQGPTRITPSGLVALAAGLLVLWLWQQPVGLVVAGFFFGLGLGILFPTFQAMINNLVEPWRRGAANSTLFTALDLGIGTGAVVTGYLASTIGLSNAFGLLTATSICGLLLYFLIAQPHYLRHTRQ